MTAELAEAPVLALARDPDLTGVAGDWHGNRRWAVQAIREMCARLPGERKLILQAGDLGIWRESGKFTWAGQLCWRQTYLEALSETLEEQDALLWFIDGNHEDHPYLAELTAGSAEGWISPRIRHLPRGTRWSWHGRTWLACGGAVSVDKLLRAPGRDWFPEEEITAGQEEAVTAAGPADVLLSHDAPSDAPLSLGDPPRPWLPMIPAADAHRDRLQRICMKVKPSHVFHGHYHQQGRELTAAGWGPCQVTALDRDGTEGNWGILDTRDMTWGWR